MTTQVNVPALPKCNFCSQKAGYDFKTLAGPWAYGCEAHYTQFRAYNILGAGRAQQLVLTP